jgi:hypothetical protein
VLSADQGFWDAYRSTYSLLAIWSPERMSEMMEGWLNQWRESGWIPQWSAPGGGGGMTGTMSDVSLSEAVVKLPHCGSEAHAARGYCVNASALYLASRRVRAIIIVPLYMENPYRSFYSSSSPRYRRRQNAFDVPPKGSPEGRVCLREYLAGRQR